MRATIRAADPESAASLSVTDESAVRVYRVPERGEAVVADKDGSVTSLGVHDISVSREFDDDGEPGYIEFYKEDSQLYVRDAGSSSETVQQNAFGEIDLSDGDPSLITGDCTVQIGYSTALEVEVEQSRGDDRPIPYKADLVLKICDVRSTNEVKSELRELKAMMHEASISDKRYRNILADVETAFENVENTRSDELPTEAVQKVSSATKRARNYFLSS
ncbi:hypothetical protein ACAH01_16385 (plasmid) [Halomicrobium sp. HM KBTZ05]|uniref:hypothetical protein n=1 Tax=Halomicrobium sp. HM KBTZ05 TaxID=3242663 RepID=UPI003559135D